MERNTRQREAIEAVMARTQRPLEPAEVLAKAKKSVPRLGIATVYRALKTLVEEGKLKRVELPGQITRYERTGLAHHHHFHCRGCGKVFDIPGCPDGLRRLTPRGFKLEGHEVMLYGTCPDCRG